MGGMHKHDVCRVDFVPDHCPEAGWRNAQAVCTQVLVLQHLWANAAFNTVFIPGAYLPSQNGIGLRGCSLECPGS